jgi:putative flippase GtrA
MHALKSIKKIYASSTFLRFVIVGVANTAFSYSTYALFLYLGLNFKIASLLSLIIGIVVSFKTQGSLVFKNKDNTLAFRFIVAWLVIYPITIFLISMFIRLGFSSYAAGALCLPFNVALSYVTQKYFVFRKKTAQQHAADVLRVDDSGK